MDDAPVLSEKIFSDKKNGKIAILHQFPEQVAIIPALNAGNNEIFNN